LTDFSKLEHDDGRDVLALRRKSSSSFVAEPLDGYAEGLVIVRCSSHFPSAWEAGSLLSPIFLDEMPARTLSKRRVAVYCMSSAI
jgi:hypothetical protein